MTAEEAGISLGGSPVPRVKQADKQVFRNGLAAFYPNTWECGTIFPRCKGSNVCLQPGVTELQKVGTRRLSRVIQK